MIKLEQYRRYLASQGLSNNTITTYMWLVQDFVATYEPRETLQANVTRWISEGQAHSSKIVRRAAMSHYAGAADVELHLPSVKGNAYRITQPPEPEQLAALEEALADNPGGMLAFLLMVDCGLRISEVVGVTARSINLQRRELTVIGKGQKRRIVPMSKRLIVAVERMLFNEPSPYESLCGLNTRFSIRSVMDRALTSKGLPSVSPHALRHLFATRLINAGVPMMDVCIMLGHASITTTQRYIHRTTDQIHESYANAIQ